MEDDFEQGLGSDADGNSPRKPEKLRAGSGMEQDLDSANEGGALIGLPPEYLWIAHCACQMYGM